MKTSVSDAQRALLERLLELTDDQARALKMGDLLRMSQISELRKATIQHAEAYLPPNLAWEPELADLVAVVKHNTECLQQSTVACMARVRRNLVQITQGAQVLHYLGREPVGQGASWQG